MTWRSLAGLGRSPRNAPAFFELDHVILAHRAVTGQCHGEHLTDIPDSLPGGSLGEVAVAVPAGLESRVGDDFKDPLGAGGDLPAGTCDPRNGMVIGHAHIQAPGAQRAASSSSTRKNSSPTLASTDRQPPTSRCRDVVRGSMKDTIPRLLGSGLLADGGDD